MSANFNLRHLILLFELHPSYLQLQHAIKPQSTFKWRLLIILDYMYYFTFEILCAHVRLGDVEKERKMKGERAET